MARRILSFILVFLFLFEQSGLAQVAGQLDLSSRIAQLQQDFSRDKFRPLHLRSLSYDPAENNFGILLDRGDQKKLDQTGVEDAADNLMRYFFVGLSLPNEAFWVNLRPDSADSVIDEDLARTDVGRILLEADVQLKKDTARLTSPETVTGKKYWEKLYAKAAELFGTENVSIPTVTRPWIVPGEVIIRGSGASAYIYKSTLKVMLEEDYLKDAPQYAFADERFKALNSYASQLLRQEVIPALTADVNTARRYAPLRQVYYSLILAQWFKENFREKGGPYARLMDHRDISGLASRQQWSPETYFKEYQRSFQHGEYNLKAVVNTALGQTVRTYTSGGILLNASSVLRDGTIKSSTPVSFRLPDNIFLEARGAASDPFDIAMSVPPETAESLAAIETSSASSAARSKQNRYVSTKNQQMLSRRQFLKWSLVGGAATAVVVTLGPSTFEWWWGFLAPDSYLNSLKNKIAGGDVSALGKLESFAWRNDKAANLLYGMAKTESAKVPMRQAALGHLVALASDGHGRAQELLLNEAVAVIRPFWNEIVSVGRVNNLEERFYGNFFTGNQFFLALCFSSEFNFGGLADVIFKRLDTNADLKNSVIKDLDIYEDFILQAATFGKLRDLIKGPDSLRETMNLLYKDLSEARIHANSIRLSTFIEDFLNPETFSSRAEYKQRKNVFSTHLVSLYRTTSGLNKRFIGLLLTGYQDRLEIFQEPDIQEELKAYSFMRDRALPSRLTGAAQRELVVHVAFMDKDSDSRFFDRTVGLLTGTLMEGDKKIFPNIGGYVKDEARSSGNRTELVKGNVRIKLFRQNSYAIQKNLGEAHVVLFRGHSGTEHALSAQLKDRPVQAKDTLIYFTECWGGKKLPSFSRDFPDALLMGSRSVGRGDVANIATYYMLEGVAGGYTRFSQVRALVNTKQRLEGPKIIMPGDVAWEIMNQLNRNFSPEMARRSSARTLTASSSLGQEEVDYRTFDEYGAFLAQARDRTGATIPADLADMEEFLDALTEKQDTVRVADIGGGFGMAMKQLNYLYPGMETYLVDIARKRLDTLTVEEVSVLAELYGDAWMEYFYARDPAFLQASMENVQLPRRMDLITSFFAMQYSADPLGSWCNLFNQLEDGGRIVAQLIVPYNEEGFFEFYQSVVDHLVSLGVNAQLFQAEDTADQMNRRLLYLIATREKGQTVRMQAAPAAIREAALKKEAGSAETMTIKVVEYAGRGDQAVSLSSGSSSLAVRLSDRISAVVRGLQVGMAERSLSLPWASEGVVQYYEHVASRVAAASKEKNGKAVESVFVPASGSDVHTVLTVTNAPTVVMADAVKLVPSAALEMSDQEMADKIRRAYRQRSQSGLMSAAMDERMAEETEGLLNTGMLIPVLAEIVAMGGTITTAFEQIASDLAAGKTTLEIKFNWRHPSEAAATARRIVLLSEVNLSGELDSRTVEQLAGFSFDMVVVKAIMRLSHNLNFTALLPRILGGSVLLFSDLEAQPQEFSEALMYQRMRERFSIEQVPVVTADQARASGYPGVYFGYGGPYLYWLSENPGTSGNNIQASSSLNEGLSFNAQREASLTRKWKEWGLALVFSGVFHVLLIGGMQFGIVPSSHSPAQQFSPQSVVYMDLKQMDAEIRPSGAESRPIDAAQQSEGAVPGATGAATGEEFFTREVSETERATIDQLLSVIRDSPYSDQINAGFTQLNESGNEGALREFFSRIGSQELARLMLMIDQQGLLSSVNSLSLLGRADLLLDVASDPQSSMKVRAAALSIWCGGAGRLNESSWPSVRSLVIDTSSSRNQLYKTAVAYLEGAAGWNELADLIAQPSLGRFARADIAVLLGKIDPSGTVRLIGNAALSNELPVEIRDSFLLSLTTLYKTIESDTARQEITGMWNTVLNESAFDLRMRGTAAAGLTSINARDILEQSKSALTGMVQEASGLLEGAEGLAGKDALTWFAVADLGLKALEAVNADRSGLWATTGKLNTALDGFIALMKQQGKTISDRAFDSIRSWAPIERSASAATTSGQEKNESVRNAAGRPLGGIDFRAVPIITQPGASGAPSAVADAALADDDVEWEEIARMVKAGIIPSSQRVKEYIQGRCQNDKSAFSLQKILGGIAGIMRLEEDQNRGTDAALKKILLIVESSRSIDTLPGELAGIEESQERK